MHLIYSQHKNYNKIKHPKLKTISKRKNKWKNNLMTKMNYNNIINKIRNSFINQFIE